jgi:hypothetical protein
MNDIANRLIVFAVSAIASGTAAFGQTALTATVPFAFHTVQGMLPAGTYELRDTELSGNPHLIFFRNVATKKGSYAGIPVSDYNRRAASVPALDFVCVQHDCFLKAIRTTETALEYSMPHKYQEYGKGFAMISIALKPVNAD